MAKKVISFIVILLVFCTAGAAVLISTINFGLGFGGMTENRSARRTRWTAREISIT
ncbi:MAG: hypothetical protein ACLSG5_05560 [Oscillospiraceae bacterium]